MAGRGSWQLLFTLMVSSIVSVAKHAHPREPIPQAARTSKLVQARSSGEFVIPYGGYFVAGRPRREPEQQAGAESAPNWGSRAGRRRGALLCRLQRPRVGRWAGRRRIGRSGVGNRGQAVERPVEGMAALLGHPTGACAVPPSRPPPATRLRRRAFPKSPASGMLEFGLRSARPKASRAPPWAGALRAIVDPPTVCAPKLVCCRCYCCRFCFY